MHVFYIKRENGMGAYKIAAESFCFLYKLLGAVAVDAFQGNSRPDYLFSVLYYFEISPLSLNRN